MKDTRNRVFRFHLNEAVKEIVENKLTKKVLKQMFLLENILQVEPIKERSLQ